ncbi:hypothetical protein LWI28_020434 [Acer negundo]|uniref:Uncharacterized protein n=1 Tax=Acer negundo TaxID=4023 RepID=A0AAD5IMH9_ACENE|nr:hypothetical protein LWI28_020434 [Acer negundo]
MVAWKDDHHLLTFDAAKHSGHGNSTAHRIDLSSFLFPSSMASPSKFPTPSPSLLPISSEPCPDLPSSTDSLDDFLEGGPEAGSLILKGKKRGRGEVDDSGKEQMPLYRRSTRNPRIGLGFHSMSEDPV